MAVPSLIDTRVLGKPDRFYGKETEYELKGEAREHVDLGKTHTIKSLEIKILEPRPANENAASGTGFAEIELIGKVKKRR